MELNKYSKTITQDPTQPASQAMLYGIGLTKADLAKAQVGIVSMGYDGNTCNMHLNDLAAIVKKGVWQNDLVGLMFHTIGISDGITNGTDGMRYSLVSREIIADSIESVVAGHYYDAVIAIPGCDKNMPGAVMGMLRINRPAIMVYGGTIASGNYKGEKLNIVSAFEAFGKRIQGTISDEDYDGVIRNACPGKGACGGMYTANTMSSAIEAMGMSLPGSAAPPAVDRRRDGYARKSGEAVVELIRQGITARDIITRQSLENAIAERLNGIMKAEFLDHHRLGGLSDVASVLRESVTTYNTLRPHMSCAMHTPEKVHAESLEVERKWKNYYPKKTNFVNLSQD